MASRIDNALIHSIIPAFQQALKGLATQEDRTDLIELLARASWTQGFLSRAEEEDNTHLVSLVDKIKSATQQPSTEAALRYLAEAGEIIDTCFPEAVRVANKPPSLEVIDPAEILRKATLFFGE